MKLKKNQLGGRKVVGPATLLAHWAQKVGGRLPPCPTGSVANALHQAQSVLRQVNGLVGTPSWYLN